MAEDAVAVFRLSPGGDLDLTDFSTIGQHLAAWATGVKTTGIRRLHRAGDISGQDNATGSMFDIGNRNTGEQGVGVRM